MYVRFSGLWTLGAERPALERLRSSLDGAESIRKLVLEGTSLEAWDSALMPFLRHCKRFADERSMEIELDGLPSGAGNLLRLSETVPAAAPESMAETSGILERVGGAALRAFGGVDAFLVFIGRLVQESGAFYLGRARMRRKDFMLLLQQTGAAALPIVSLLSFLMGLIIAFIGVIQLQKFAADIYVADLVGLATTRELGAVMTGVIMAGRTGAAFAAQIGSMRANEEVDALTVFGIAPIQFLVLPRTIALVLMMPLLCCFANGVSILGGMLVAVGISDVSVIQYFNQVKAAVDVSDLLVGIFKSGVFGLIIAVAGCYRGLCSGKNAGAVGQAATRAVVTGITWIVVADAIFAVLFHVLGI